MRALARVRSRPAVAKQHSSPRVTNHSCPPLDRGVSAYLLSDREGSRLDLFSGTLFHWAQTSESCVQSMTEEVGGASPWQRGKPGERTLTLTTLGGGTTRRGGSWWASSLRSLENAVLARLPHLGNASTLGCELQFVHMNTLQVLADPIQSAISTNQKYYVIAKQCMVEAGHKGQLKGEVKAVRVLCSRNGKIPPQAFSFCTEIRHVLVENGVKIVGEAAWRCCRQLQIVHLPDTVVGLLHGAFSKCQVLRVVVAPSCKYFGTKVFEECCSLTQVGAAHCPSNKLAPQAQLRPRAFQACTALRNINLGMSESATTYPNRCLPDCCFQESGIVELALPTSFHRIGFAACMSCQQLQIVDLSQTDVLEILGSTFAHCSQLQQLCLPRMLRTIEQEAFYKCISLKEVSTPPSLLYIARHAFAGCTHLRIILKQGKSSTWRGTYAQSNAFDKCEHFDKPTWLRVLPNDANDLWREDYLDPAPKTSNASEAGEEQGRRG